MDLLADQRRDEEFTDFVRARGASLLQTATYLCANADQAQDLVQVTFTKTYLAWPAARRTEPYAYARRVLVNSNIDRWRRRRWRERADSDVASHPDAPRVKDPAGQVVERALLLAALSELTRRERVVLVLRFYEDLSERDTASLLGVTAGTIKSTTSRALAKLRLHPDLQPVSEERSHADL